MTILSIDPGVCERSVKRVIKLVDGCALALFHELRVVEIGFERYDGRPNYVPLLERVVVERPEQDGRSFNARPRDLMNLAWDGAILAASYGVPVKWYKPSEWKGQLHKPVHHSKVWRKLDRGERALFPADTADVIEAAVQAGAMDRWRQDGKAYYPRSWVFHNILDAVALGRHDLLGDEAW